MRKAGRMHSIQQDMAEFRRQLEKGSIQRAYGALLSYMMRLRTHFVNKYGESAVSGLYQGYMDMTYFALFPSFLKHRELKVAIVFNYGAFRFEAWLAGRNRKVQQHYYELFQDRQGTKYRVVAPAKGIDSILECDLSEDIDLNEPDRLTSRIELMTTEFIDNVERFLSEYQHGEETREATR
jgi:hypothetical protein